MSTPADVLALLKNLSGKKALSFQFIERGPDPVNGFPAIQALETKYKKWLAGIGGDLYYFNAPLSFAADPTFIVKYAIPYVQAGGLATLCVSMPNPTTGGGQQDTTINGADLTTPGTVTYKNFQYLLQQIGICLAPAAKASAVILLRPFHEINGDWMWWGCLSDAQKVWVFRQLKDYLTKTMGYTNLLFCLSLNSGVSSSLPFSAAAYPGDAYVDMIGLDAYTSDPMQITADIAWLAKTYPTKPLWLSEFGSGSPTAGDLNFDAEVLVTALKSMPNLFGFQNWWSGNSDKPGWGIEGEQDLTAFFADPYIAYRGDFTVGGIVTTSPTTPDTPTPTPTPPVTTTPVVSPTITCTSGGSITDGNGAIWTLTTAGALEVGGAEIDGGEGTMAACVVNGVLWAQESAQPQAWFTYINGAFTLQSTTPPAATPSAPVTTAPGMNAAQKAAVIEALDESIAQANTQITNLQAAKAIITSL